MSKQNEAEIIKVINKLKSEIENYIEENGDKAIRDFLSKNFALPGKDIIVFIKTIDNMVPGLPYNATPMEWIFTEKRVLSKILTDHISDIQREYPKIMEYVKMFRKLSNGLQIKLENYWPDKLWVVVNQKTVTKDNRCLNAYGPSHVAKEILAYRYCTTYETVNSYLKMK